VLIVDSTAGEVLTILNTTDSSYAVVFNKQGTQLAVAEYGEFTVWDAQTYEELLAWGYYMGSMNLTFSPDGSLLAVGFMGMPHSPLYLFWNIMPGSYEGNAFGFFSIGGAVGIAVNSDNSRLASGDCNEIHLWDISTRDKILQLDASSPLVSLEGHSACVEELLYTPMDNFHHNPEICHGIQVIILSFVPCGRDFAMSRTLLNWPLLL
jgi:WD40 repeat protein